MLSPNLLECKDTVGSTIWLYFAADRPTTLAFLHENCIRNDLERPEIPNFLWGHAPRPLYLACFMRFNMLARIFQLDHFKSGGYGPGTNFGKIHLLDLQTTQNKLQKNHFTEQHSCRDAFPQKRGKQATTHTAIHSQTTYLFMFTSQPNYRVATNHNAVLFQRPSPYISSPRIVSINALHYDLYYSVMDWAVMCGWGVSNKEEWCGGKV